MKKKILALLSGFSTLALASTAFAQDAASNSYDANMFIALAAGLGIGIAAFGGADADFEYAVLANLLFLTALRQLVVVLSSYGKSRLSRELAKRPTVVPVLLHSFVTTAFAAAVIFPPGRPSLDEQPLTIWLWRRWVLPFSMGYWLFDLYF